MTRDLSNAQLVALELDTNTGDLDRTAATAELQRRHDLGMAAVWVKLTTMPPEATAFIGAWMVRGKAGCKHCHGQGQLGHLAHKGISVMDGGMKPVTTTKDKDGVPAGTKVWVPTVKRQEVPAGTAVPCRCLHVNVTAVQEAIEFKRQELEQQAKLQRLAEEAGAAEGQAAAAEARQ